MPLKIILAIEGVTLTGQLSDSPPGRALAARLPLEMALSRWGDEYYGSIGDPLDEISGDTQEVMKKGDLAYWEPGTAFCLFFGPTPMSSGAEPVAAGPVHLVGSVGGDWSALKALGSTVKATLDKS
jgi:hypothetical protein